MRKIYLILVCSLVLFARVPNASDFTNGRLITKNNTQVSLVYDVNTSVVAQFHIPNLSITSISRPTYNILLDGISYRNMHPVSATISSGVLSLVFDSNITIPDTNDISILSGIFRRSIGDSANNDITIGDDPTDKAYPILISAETNDQSNNGKIDEIKLTFSEPIKIGSSSNANGLSVSGYTITHLSSSSGGNTNASGGPFASIWIRLSEKSSYDTGVKPAITYAKPSDGNITDRSYNGIFNSFITTDKAKPYFVSLTAKSIHNGGDEIYLGFSEAISHNSSVKATDYVSFGDINGHGNKDSTISFASDSKSATITLNELYNVYISDNGTPDITILSTDFNGNSFSNGGSRSTPIVVPKETIKPKLLSISRIGDEGKLKITFSEAMDKDLGGKSYFTINKLTKRHDSNITTKTSSSTSGALSQDKKVLTINVIMRKFSNTETRQIQVIASQSVKDLVGNVIDSSDNNKTYTIAIDNTAPQLHSINNVSFDMSNAGELKFTFNEKVSISTFDYSKILIHTDKESMHLTTSSNAIYDDDSIIINLNEDLNRTKVFFNHRKSTSQDINFSILANSGIIDYASNAYLGGETFLTFGSVAPDTVPPILLSWDFNLTNKKMILRFNEPMSIGSYDASGIQLVKADNTNIAFMANNSTAKLIDNDINVEITLLSSQVNAILQSSVAKSKSDTLLTMSIDVLEDVFSNNNSIVTKQVSSNWSSEYNTTVSIDVIPNRWHQISVKYPISSLDLLRTNKIDYVYTFKDYGWVRTPITLEPKIGYWIKTTNRSSNTITIPSIIKPIGTKEEDLARIRDTNNTSFKLIAIENNTTRDEIFSDVPSACKSLRVHHYFPDVNASKSSWDYNKTYLSNFGLWVQCVK